MGIYLNSGASRFQSSLRSEIYVDKSSMLVYLNKVLDTEQRYVCVTRPRRFGKSMAANMISAYYDRTTDAAKLFHGLAIADDPHFEKYANHYDVIFLNMQKFLSRTRSIDEMISLLQQKVLRDLIREYPDCRYFDKTQLARSMADIYQQTDRLFVIVIDEWDCIFREYPDRNADQKQYLDFLRNWLKDRAYVGLAYMTGILPIKKFGTHSELNMFDEFSMTNAGPMAPYTGFTEPEVRQLCARYSMDFEECTAWYGGYRLRSGAIYNPYSIVQSMMRRYFNTYWNQTETLDALRLYLDMNYSGLHEAVRALMAGSLQRINIGTFNNDMTTFSGYEDILTLLVHLGYLGYDTEKKSVFIPNQELQKEFASATSISK